MNLLQKQKKIIILTFLIFIVVVHLFFVALSYKTEYTTPFSASYWKARYESSQWVVPNSTNSIGDDGLYAYAGWNYITGGNPVLLNAEIPPLGKYIIGLGELLFGNQNILMLIIGVSCLVVFYLLNLKLFANKVLAFVPVLLFSFDPLFTSQLRAPYLDTIYLLFLLLTLYAALQKKYMWVGIFLGCFAATKFPFGSLFLFAPILVWVYVFDKKNLRRFILNMIFWPIIFTLSYVMYFVQGGTFFGFLGVQKWIAHFYTTGAKAPYGIVYPMILFGQWHTWFAGVQKVTEWTILWPISFIGSIFAGLGFIMEYVRQKKVKIEHSGRVLIFLWVCSYLVFLTFTPVFPRYLLLLLPFMYNLTIWFLTRYVLQRFSSS